ncbi:MAG TPA: hypothetical protein PKC62_01315 [Ferruginibacter sp.]|nr:hypothetical protein [Ferruginibacter sp.]
MNKKPYSQVEEQIKSAAQNWEANFDEQAWQQMEKLLDEKDDRKRPVLWWLWLLPILAGVAVMGYLGFKNYGTSAKKLPVTVTESSAPKTNKVQAHTSVIEAAPLLKPETAKEQNANKPTGSNPTVHSIAQVPSILKESMVKETTDSDGEKHTAKKKVSGKLNSKSKINISPADTEAEASPGQEPSLQNQTADSPFSSKPVADAMQNQNIVEGDEENEVKQSTDKTSQPQDSGITKNPVKDTDSLAQGKKSNSKTGSAHSKFYFSIYTGAEGSGVKFPGLNKFNLRVGLSAGYYVSKRLSVQAGFFTGTKKYIAGKKDYKAKPGTYWSRVDITRVDANCRVLEIPVSLKYDFKAKNNWQAFAGAGLSSFIMKKETYAYDYLYYGMPNHALASYEGNKHWFSVFKIFGGVEKTFSNSLSWFVQPGIAIPLAGVGEGQIKLFSSEILLGIKLRPQKKN